MINLEANIRTLERGPLLLLNNGSQVATLFLSEVRRRMNTVTIDLGSMTIEEAYDKVLALAADILPIFLVPKKITDIEIGNLTHFMLKREEYYCGGRSMDFESMRYLVVIEGDSIDAIDEEYRPVSYGVLCYIPEPFVKLRILGDLAIGMYDTGAVKAYRRIGTDWEEEEKASAVAAEMAEKIDMERNPEWTVQQFYKKLFRALDERK